MHADLDERGEDGNEQRIASADPTDGQADGRTGQAGRTAAPVPVAAAVAEVVAANADRPALGERAAELVTDPESGRSTLRLLPGFSTISYGELWARVGAVAAEWGRDARRRIGAGDFVALYGFTSSDYTTLDLACLYLGAVSVPLQSGASPAQLTPILAEVEPRVLATSVELLDRAVELALASTSKPRLIVFDHHPEVDDERERFEAARARLEEAGLPGIDSFDAVLERGRALPPAPIAAGGSDGESVRLLIYTSGSTGAPKGAVYTDGMLRRLWEGWSPETGERPVTINYMPLSHVAGRAALLETLSHGGTAYFTAESNLSSLFEDIGLVRPTRLFLVPRICDLLYQEYQSEATRRAAEFDDPAALEAAVLTDLRERFLGGRVNQLICGSAPISAALRQFMESCLGLHLYDGFGTTEIGMVLFDSYVQRPPVIDYKLVDVPELGYFHTDSPHPRGELLIRSEAVTPGYYKRPELTAGFFDEDGFYKTGDVMAEVGPDQLVYVDRRNNVQKLSQGEFVAVSRLESVYVESPLIRQIYVYGNSERAYLLAVVVPTEAATARAAGPEELRSLLAESLQRVALDAGLNSYEIPRDLLIETEPFSAENGLLSEIRKNLRPRLKERYGERLEQLYDELAEGQQDELRALRGAAADQPVFETVRQAARALLGSSSADLDGATHFVELGGDSLSALTLSKLLREIFGVEVPVGVVLSPANDLRAIADHIEAERASGLRRPSFATVHGAHATEVRAAELTLEKFIDAETLRAAGTAQATHTAQAAQTVLLTGANGYLGRFMCLDWLERLAGTGGRLICIVRGRDAAAARARLDGAFERGDAQLTSRYRELAAKHLEVLAGDIGEDRLGLDPETWNRLAEDVDLIMHPAALVNHVLPYDQLFGPNVLGTATLIRLAITGRLKPITYLSTIGVAAQLDPSSLDETADIRVLSPVRKLDDSYAGGYGTSKWAGEVLLREAHEAFGLPVATFRSDMIMAHSRYTGQLNVADMFSRLLLSLLTTGIAPRSFYRADAREDRRRAHYDGLPVDFTAEAVDTLGARSTEGYRTYNVLNPHDDGISLDTFVDWLIDAGHPIQRVEDYDDWYARFATALRALPENRRQQSVLPLLHAFQHPEEPVNGTLTPVDRFQAAVREAGVGGLADIPHLSVELIDKYATDLRQLDLL
jgi:fatty acid CoA ligase FadD9